MPDDPKIDVPLAEGSEIIGSVVHRHPQSVMVYIDTSTDPSEVLAFYEREYSARGWRPQLLNMPRPESGFLAAASDPRQQMRVFCKGETEPYYRLEVRAQAPRILLSWHAMSQGIVHPCSSGPSDPRMFGAPSVVIPRLEGPPGVAVRGGGGGGSTDEWSTYGSALTSMPANELMDHFIGKVSEQGHDLIERGEGDRVAWSRWRMKEQGWEGFLIVAEQRPDVRHLTFLSYTESALEGLRRQWTFTGGWTSHRIGG